MIGWKECEEGEKSERNEEQGQRELTDGRRNGVTGEEPEKIRSYRLKEIKTNRQEKGKRLKQMSGKQKPRGVDNTLGEHMVSDGEETRPPTKLSKARRSMPLCHSRRQVRGSRTCAAVIDG